MCDLNNPIEGKTVFQNKTNKLNRLYYSRVIQKRQVIGNAVPVLNKLQQIYPGDYSIKSNNEETFEDRPK